MRKILLLIAVLSFGLASSAYDYTITDYSVYMKVNENNTFNIYEKIGTYFNTQKHGIIREIPLQNKVVRLDGTTSYNRAKISDIKVNEEYTLSNAGSSKVIKIGNAGFTITGPKKYEIQYLYNIGKDTGKGYDELYFNIIGPEWDTKIDNIEFVIKMPKAFDESKLGFSSGNVGSTDSKVTYNVKENVITGKYKGTLNPGKAITVRLELPEGYFVGASNNFDYAVLFTMFLPVVFALISFAMWAKHGKDDPVVETVEFYPPEGFNSAEVGFLYKGESETNDVVSLLIYLANKGYLRIEEAASEFKFIKLKEYDGRNENEKMFLTGLFGSANEATAVSLYNKFYNTLNKIQLNLREENIKNIFEKTSLEKRGFVFLMIIITLILITVKPAMESGGTKALHSVLWFQAAGFSVMFFSKPSLAPVGLFNKIFGLVFVCVPVCTYILPILQTDPIYFAAYIAGLVCIFVMIFFYKIMTKRTPFGRAILGKIRGFRNFLEIAEKPKLETLVTQDPSYFYNILPFTYALGVSDKWIKKFERIALQAPDWYSSNKVFTATSFGHFMNSTMASASTAMSSSPSSSSSSGGGSSGRGSGGGGGRSW